MPEGRPQYAREDICTKRSEITYTAYKAKTGDPYTVHIGPQQAWVIRYFAQHPVGEAYGDEPVFIYPYKASQLRARITELQQADLLIKSNQEGPLIAYAISAKGRLLFKRLLEEGWYA